MKILLTVEFYNPHKGGAQKVVEDVAVGLTQRGHDVTVATTYLSARKSDELRGVKIESFRLSGNAAGGIKGSKREIGRYQDLILQGGFDVIFNYAAQSWTTDLTLPLLKEIESAKVLAPVGYSRLKSPHYKMYFNTLPAYLQGYDKLVYHSSHYQDKVFGDENGLECKALIIQNGALREEFLSTDGPNVRERLNIKTPYLLLTVSHHNIAKGHRFVIKAFKKMNRDDVTLLIIGDRLTSRGLRKLVHFVLDYLYCFISSALNKNIRLVSSRDREFVISAYKSADLSLSGSRIECAPLIMYEAFASKTPFITTEVGNVRDHDDYLKIVKTPGEMAQAVNYLLDHTKERQSLAEKVFKVWRDDYTVEGIVDKYEELFLSILS